MRKIVLTLLFLSSALSAIGAETPDSTAAAGLKLKFLYNVNFQYRLENNEYDASKGIFENSSTLHSVVLSPGVGLGISQDGGRIRHRLFAGVDVLKHMGSSVYAGGLILEPIIYYRLDTRLGNGDFCGAAGIIPREFSEGYYGTAFFSPRKLFLDPNVEGMFFKYRTPRLYSEITLDWMGMYGKDTRERFQIFTAGSYSFPYSISAGWAASLYHFACAANLPNVVDNHKIYVYAKWDALNFFKDKLPHYFQELNGDLGPIVGYQRDRSAPNSTIFPWGIIANQNLRLFNAGIANTFYYGEDLMLYYGVVYNGVQYGSDLYFGERFYHTHIRGTSFYDRLEAFYEPRIAPWLDLRVSLVFHMGNPTTAFPAFRGWQQVFSLKFNLEKLLNKYVK